MRGARATSGPPSFAPIHSSPRAPRVKSTASVPRKATRHTTATVQATGKRPQGSPRRRTGGNAGHRLQRDYNVARRLKAVFGIFIETMTDHVFDGRVLQLRQWRRIFRHNGGDEFRLRGALEGAASFAHF